MYLKRLEIQGFKSFADKVEFEFSPGITAIVGPNGSGKSNVVDSIRWVLGEQSAKSLRGSKMDDIIFAGSVDRRPVGMAQVALTLDNSEGLFPLDYNEVTVARRLYRSGESEYLINKTPCRLKDIHELFMDTGLGREGFSIISQGKVDEILSLKPEDRRGLIEEAAGIIKYKHRKKEAERKLEDTQENMTRLNDIIAELKERVAPLGEQAEKAKNYSLWKNELDDLEISLEVSRLEVNIAAEAGLGAQLGACEDALAGQMAEYGQCAAKLTEDKLRLQEMDQTISTAQERYYTLSTQLEKKEAEIVLASQLKASYAEQRQRLLAESGQMREELAVIARDYQQKNAQAEELAASVEESRVQKRQLEKQIAQQIAEQQQTKTETEQNREQLMSNMREQAKSNNEVSRLRQERVNHDHRLERLNQKAARLGADGDAMTQELAQQIAEQAQFDQDCEQYEKALGEHKAQLQEKQEALRREQETFQASQQLLQQSESRHRALQELEEAGDGYQYGVKSVLEQKKAGHLSGIVGTVAQLIQVPDELERAIETTLGNALQNIIVVDDTFAQAAIHYLKKNQKGRATFLPMNTVKGTRSAEKQNADGVLGLAVDLISFAPEYTAVMNYLLGRVWVVRTLAQAAAIGKQKGFNQRLVTLEGDLITPGGAMTGGNYARQNGGLLARKRQISALAQQSEALAAELAARRQQLERLESDIAALSAQRDTAIVQGQQYQLRRQELGQKREQILKEKHRLSNELEIELMDKRQIDAEVAQLQQDLSREIENSRRIQQSKEELEEQGRQLAQRQKQRDSVLEAQQAELQQSQIQLATSEQRLGIFREQYNQLKKRHEEMTIRAGEKEAELCNLDEKTRVAQAEVGENKTEMSRLAMQTEQEQRALGQHKDARASLQETINQEEDEAKEKQRQLDGQKESKYQLDMALSKVRLQMENALKHLEQSFACTYEEALLRKITISDEKEAAKRAGKLKQSIQSLGAINFNAIDEHQQVQERLVFLTEQMDDLQQARLSLNKVIKDMEQIMAQKFKETYQVVNETFSAVFRSMFDGGAARLELSAPHDYLLTGIEIVAQPPGKKEQILSLLSGGERAMTAIALLFALLTVKPSPFCILDEIEAALDEVNVDRFARFIREYTNKTQFIVISHRKGTMEAADTLYGVAMENNGVSQLMSVKLGEYH